MSRIVSTTYSHIYVALSNGEQQLVGCISEAISDTHQCLGMLSLYEVPEEVGGLVSPVLEPLIEDGLSTVLKENLFNEAWEKASYGECLSYLARAHQGAIFVETPTTLPNGHNIDDIEAHVLSVLREGWDFAHSTTSLEGRDKAA